jgi:heptosyltransferase-2
LMGKPWETVRKYLDLTNLERIQESMNRVGSVVWAINHIGNWELFVYTTRIVRPATHGVVYRALSNRFIDTHVRRVRGSTGLKLIERQHGLAQCTNLLKSGGMLAVLVDQHAGDKGVWTPFFDRLASTTPLPAILAKKTGTQLLPVAIFTTGPAQWRLEVGDFIPQEGASTEELMHRVNRALEALIIRRPSDWFWVHQRWETPSPKFLLQDYKRGVCTPRDVTVLASQFSQSCYRGLAGGYPAAGRLFSPLAKRLCQPIGSRTEGATSDEPSEDALFANSRADRGGSDQGVA